jgi:release factor glutamine methyltransferase
LTLHDKLADAHARLVAAGISQSEASVDVGLYACTILGWDRARLLAEQRGSVPAALEPTFSQWIARREQREPSAYIVGVREFWGRDFEVSHAVLIPRPETELIVEEVLALPARPRRLADIGTGSGCLAVTLALEIADSSIAATDLSSAALQVARRNAARYGVANRVECIETSYLDGVEGVFDVIVANPPYVKDNARNALARDVRHEPEVALFGGPEGLRDISGVLDAALSKLKPGGWLIMEFGYGQEDDVRTLVDARAALAVAKIRGDLQGIARTAIILRR